MRYCVVIFLSLILFNCSNTKTVFWCGDHACKNNKEKKAYFKENMVVEIKELNKNKKKDKSNMDIIKETFSPKNKKQIKEEKKLAKQLLKDEKKRLKEEKKLAKIYQANEKKKIKKDKKLAKKLKKDKKKMKKNSTNKQLDKIFTKDSTLDSSDKFTDIVNKILKRNKNKPFPDINSINLE
tara:strand:+ start:818 stop:1360 length:543 start_codon:yes stop_codon:yes gene_type:complete